VSLDPVCGRRQAASTKTIRSSSACHLFAWDIIVEEALFKLPPQKDESQPVAAYEQVLERMDKFAEQQELLLQEVGILPSQED
jgi:hypothetical protein